MGRKGQMFSAERIGLILIAAALLAIAAVMIFRRPEPPQTAPDDVHQTIVDSVKGGELPAPSTDTVSAPDKGKGKSKKSTKKKKDTSPRPTPPPRNHLDEPIN